MLKIGERKKRFQKGQATLTDALFFLTVVTIISTLLFVSSLRYGKSLEPKLKEQFINEYVGSATKTFFWVSTQVGDNPEKQEYVSVFLKTIFFNDLVEDTCLTNRENSNCDFDQTKHISKEMYDAAPPHPKINLSHMVVDTMKDLMEPVSSAYDYFWYIKGTEAGMSDWFPLFLLRYSGNYYLCSPTSWDDVEQKLLMRAGNTYSFKTFFSSISPWMTDPKVVYFDFGIVTWLIKTDMLDDSTLGELNCEKI